MYKNDNLTEHYNHLIGIANSINPSKLTILTGGNATGKSLIQTQMQFMLSTQFDVNIKVARKMIRHISMNTRTQNRPELGALSGVGHDLTWIATSQNTLSIIDKMFKSINDNVKYLIFDEPEIGCSDETTYAIALYLNKKIKELNNKNVGVLLITHSKYMVTHFNHDVFINIEEMSEQEWLTRKITPTNLELLAENKLFAFVRDTNNTNK